MALYVYGIMRARDAADALSATRRSGDRPLDVVEHQGISALVSPAAEDGPTLQRDSIIGHADVLRAAFEHGPVLPLRFGTALVDKDAVIRELLAPGADRLAARLEWLDQKVELQLKVTYREEPLLRSVLTQNPKLAQAAARIRQLPAAATHFERIRIGEAIAVAVQERQTADQEALLGALSPLSVAVSVAAPHHERAVLNAAFLVERRALDRFDAEADKLSEAGASDAEFKLIGPLPPYSFANHEWEAAGAEEAQPAWA